MATPNRYAIREAADCTIGSLVTPYNALATMRTLKTTGVQSKSTTVYARGGKGNVKVIGFSGDKESSITLQDAIVDNEIIALLTGVAVSTAAIAVDQIYEGTTPAGLTLTLPNKVKSITSVYILDTDGVTNKTLLAVNPAASAGTKYSIAGQVLTFADTAGTKYRIYYKSDTDATAKTMKLQSDKYPGSYRLTLDVLVRDEYTKADYAGQLVIFNAKLEDDWKMEFKPDGEPMPVDLKFEVLKSSSSTDMWQLVIYDETLIPTS